MQLHLAQHMVPLGKNVLLTLQAQGQGQLVLTLLELGLLFTVPTGVSTLRQSSEGALPTRPPNVSPTSRQTSAQPLGLSRPWSDPCMMDPGTHSLTDEYL